MNSEDLNKNSIDVTEIQLRDSRIPESFREIPKKKQTDSDNFFSSTQDSRLVNQSGDISSSYYPDKEGKYSNSAELKSEVNFAKEGKEFLDQFLEERELLDSGISQNIPVKTNSEVPDIESLSFKSSRNSNELGHGSDQILNLGNYPIRDIISRRDQQDRYVFDDQIRLKKKVCLFCNNLFSFAPYSEILDCKHLCFSCFIVFVKLGGNECPCCKVKINCAQLILDCTSCQKNDLNIGISLCYRSIHCIPCALGNISQKKCGCCEGNLNENSYSRVIAVEVLKKFI